MDLARFLLSHQGMVEDLTGLILAGAVAFAYIGVPKIIRHSRRELDSQYAGDPMGGTWFAKDPKYRPATN